MMTDWNKLNYSLSGHDPETTRVVIGLFRTLPEMKQAAGALNRHQFVDEDLVHIINQNKVSPDDVTNGQIRRMTKILVEAGIPAQKAGVYADKLGQGYVLLLVRTGVERVREAMNIMSYANAEDIEEHTSGKNDSDCIKLKNRSRAVSRSTSL